MDSRHPVVQTQIAALEETNNGTSKANSVYTSSIYSASPAQDKPPATQLDSPNGSRNGSRHGSRHHYTPSYMSHVATPSNETLTIRTTESQNINSKPVSNPLSQPTAHEVDAPLTAPVVPEIARGPSGLLLVLVANSVHPSTIFYLEMLLNRQSFSGILFAANRSQEAALKQLKMDVYALIGRLRKELIVSVHLKHEWGQAEIGAVVSDATQHADGVQGVLCCPEYDEGVAGDLDIIDLECEQLDRSWRRSVAYVHASLKATAIHLLAKCKPQLLMKSGPPSRVSKGPFFLVAGSTTTTSAAQVTKAASDTLIHQFEQATLSKGLTVGFAEALLIPEPTREPPPTPKDESALQIDTQGLAPETVDFVPSESPTKLWSSWALTNDLDFAAD